MDLFEILDSDTFKLGFIGGVGFAIGFVRKDTPRVGSDK